MGTDRFEVYRKSCTCGSGLFVITECSPDHPYARPSQTSWITEITCPECVKEFALEQQGSTICRVRRLDQAAQATAQKAWHTKVEEIQNCAESSGHYEALGSWLASFPSTAAVQRAVSCLTSRTTASTFRKYYTRSDPKGWARRNIHYTNLPTALEKLGRADPILDALIAESEVLWQQRSEIPMVEVIYRTR